MSENLLFLIALFIIDGLKLISFKITVSDSKIQIKIFYILEDIKRFKLFWEAIENQINEIEKVMMHSGIESYQISFKKVDPQILRLIP